MNGSANRKLSRLVMTECLWNVSYICAPLIRLALTPIYCDNIQGEYAVGCSGYDPRERSKHRLVELADNITVEDLRFGHRYADILELSEDDRTVLNYHRFHLTQVDSARGRRVDDVREGGIRETA